MFDAIFFDLDGTLVDTERVALHTGIRAFAAVGHEVDAGFMHRLVGKAEPQAAQKQQEEQAAAVDAAPPKEVISEEEVQQAVDEAVAAQLQVRLGCSYWVQR